MSYFTLHILAMGVCPIGWEAFNRTCYIFDHEADITPEEAEGDCIIRGSTLATIHSDDEQRFLAGKSLCYY